MQRAKNKSTYLMPHYLRESHAIDRLTIAEISQCTSEFMQQKALHDDEGEPANGFGIIDINIAQAKRSAINLCNETLSPKKQANRRARSSEIFLCLPVMKGDSRLPFAMSDLGSHLYTAPKPPRKSPLTHTIEPHGSNLSLHQPQSLANDFHGDQNDSQQASSRFSLAHELAAALVPDSNSASRSLAAEFGIEFDEEAEGIEEEAQQ